MIERDFHCSNSFPLESGQVLQEVNIHYCTSSLNRDGKKVIWICHALTANANPEEWWPTLVGPNRFFDTNKYFIVCANILGSCYGTTGPGSPSIDGKPYLINFPFVTVRDLVFAHELLRKYLQIDTIDLLIGGSNGGFQAIEWAIINPKVIQNLVLIATNAIVSPWCTAFNQSQRLSIEADPSFREAKDISGGAKGLAAARSIALLSYRSYFGYYETQNEESLDPDFLLAKKASSYQSYQGKKLVDRFNAYSYYTLSLNVDSHNVGRGRGGVEKALKGIKAKSLCIAIDSDLLFPINEMKRLSDAIPNCCLEIISSLFGHDGFLLEYEQLIEKIKKHIKL